MTLRAIAGCLLAMATACHPPARNDNTPAPLVAPAAATRPPIEPAPPAEPSRSPGQDTYDQAYALAIAGDYTAALPLFREATARDPQLTLAWFDQARLLEIMQDQPAALVAMERCVAVEPRFAQARAELASLILDVREDGRAAVAHLRLALIEPAPFVTGRGDFPEHLRGVALHKLAIAYARLDFPGATAAIEGSLLADPNAEADRRSDELRREAERQLGSEFFAVRRQALDRWRTRRARRRSASGFRISTDQPDTRRTPAPGTRFAVPASMPTLAHEAPLVVLRESPALVPALLRESISPPRYGRLVLAPPTVPERRTLLATSTGEPMQPVRLYYTLPRTARVGVMRSLARLRCVDRAPNAPLWGWWHRDEAATLDFSAFAANAAPSRKPVLLATIALPKTGKMIVTLRSYHRALLAARFFAPLLGDRVDLSRVRVLNRWVSADEHGRGIEAIDALLDRNVVVKDPREVEAALSAMAAGRERRGPISTEELEQLCAEALERTRGEDVPEVEDLPLHPEEETPTFAHLKLTLDLRFLRASHHWKGQTHVTLRDLILETVNQADGARARD